MPSASVAAYRIPSRTEPSEIWRPDGPRNRQQQLAAGPIKRVELAGRLARALQRVQQDDVPGDRRNAELGAVIWYDHVSCDPSSVTAWRTPSCDET